MHDNIGHGSHKEIRGLDIKFFSKSREMIGYLFLDGFYREAIGIAATVGDGLGKASYAAE